MEHKSNKLIRHVAKPDAYARVWKNNWSEIKDNFCKIPGNENPSWNDDLTVTYVEGENSVFHFTLTSKNNL